MEEIITSSSELNKYKIREIKDGIRALIATVDWRDTTCDCWIECVTDIGHKVRIEPDKTGWRDGRKEIRVFDCTTGENKSLYFDVSRGYTMPHEITMNDADAKELMFDIPNPVLNWAIERAV